MGKTGGKKRGKKNPMVSKAESLPIIIVSFLRSLTT
jgi:hypothetical protein